MNAVKLDSKTCQVAIGQRVYCGLYGGKYGYVTAIHPNTVDVVFEDHFSNGLPVCILRGVQWEIYDYVATAEELAQAVENCKAEMERTRLQKLAAKDQFDAEVQHLKAAKEYAHLAQAGEGDWGGVFVAKNVRKDLKKHFPKIKFSVKSDHNSCSVRWTDGPTTGQVKAVVGKYKTGYYCQLSDCHLNQSSPWNVVYGGCSYVFAERSVLPETKARIFSHHFPGGLVCQGEKIENYNNGGRFNHTAENVISERINQTEIGADGSLIVRE